MVFLVTSTITPHPIALDAWVVVPMSLQGTPGGWWGSDQLPRDQDGAGRTSVSCVHPQPRQRSWELPGMQNIEPFRLEKRKSDAQVSKIVATPPAVFFSALTSNWNGSVRIQWVVNRCACTPLPWWLQRPTVNSAALDSPSIIIFHFFGRRSCPPPHPPLFHLVSLILQIR